MLKIITLCIVYVFTSQLGMCRSDEEGVTTLKSGGSHVSPREDNAGGERMQCDRSDDSSNSSDSGLGTPPTHPTSLSKRMSAVQLPPCERYQHHVLKEIYEQPAALRRTFESVRGVLEAPLNLLLEEDDDTFNHIFIVGCGGSYHVGGIAVAWFESMGKTVSRRFSSDLKESDVRANTFYVVISQSGETEETIDALQKIRAGDRPFVAIVNEEKSTLVEQSEGKYLLMNAGKEHGIVTTKTATSQLLALYILSQFCSKNDLPQNDTNLLLKATEETLKLRPAMREAARHISDAENILFIGRGWSHYLGYDAALRFTELTNVHAQAFCGEELHHGYSGFIVRPGVAVVVFAPSGDDYNNTLKDIINVAAKEVNLVVLTDKVGIGTIRKTFTTMPENIYLVTLPPAVPHWRPFVYMTANQLIAYEAAVSIMNSPRLEGRKSTPFPLERDVIPTSPPPSD